MDIDALLDAAKDTLSVRRVFGEPLERDGALVIPVAVVAGGGGVGQSEGRTDRPGEDVGIGFGMWARPIGVYVVRDGRVEFRPTIDVIPLALGAAFLVGSLIRAWSRRRR